MSVINCNIDIKHLSRVEGHGNLKICIKNGIVKKARWEVVETARFFEKMLVGKKFNNLPFISSRICGICSISHNLTAIRAIENCFGFTPSVQTQRLRLLLKQREPLLRHTYDSRRFTSFK